MACHQHNRQPPQNFFWIFKDQFTAWTDTTASSHGTPAGFQTMQLWSYNHTTASSQGTSAGFVSIYGLNRHNSECPRNSCRISDNTVIIDTTWDPGSRRDSTSPTPLTKGYTDRNACDSTATTTVFGFSPGESVLRYCITGCLGSLVTGFQAHNSG